MPEIATASPFIDPNTDGVQLPLPNATEKIVPLPPALPAKYRRRYKNPVLQRGQRQPEDSRAALAEDLTIVLNELRNETVDPDVPWLLRASTSPLSRLRLADLPTTPFSALTWRILPSWSLFTAWAGWVIRRLDATKGFKPYFVRERERYFP